MHYVFSFCVLSAEAQQTYTHTHTHMSGSFYARKTHHEQDCRRQLCSADKYAEEKKKTTKENGEVRTRKTDEKDVLVVEDGKTYFIFVTVPGVFREYSFLDFIPSDACVWCARDYGWHDMKKCPWARLSPYKKILKTGVIAQ